MEIGESGAKQEKEIVVRRLEEEKDQNQNDEFDLYSV